MIYTNITIEESQAKVKSGESYAHLSGRRAPSMLPHFPKKESYIPPTEGHAESQIILLGHKRSYIGPNQH